MLLKDFTYIGSISWPSVIIFKVNIKQEKEEWNIALIVLKAMCLTSIYAIAMHAFRFFPVVTSYMQTILTPCADLCLNESIWLQLPTVFLTDFMILSYYKERQ